MPSNPILHPRLPLPAKILLWFFLNVALLAGVFLLLFNAQFHFDLNWLLSGSARDRVDALRDLVTSDLNSADPDDWDTVIARHAAAHHVRLSLFDDAGNLLIGSVDNLPDEVSARLIPPPRPPGAPPSPPPPTTPAPVPQTTGSAPQTTGSASDARGRPPWWRGRREDLLRTANPTHYWLLLGMRLDNPQVGGAMRTILVADDSSVGMGGLILDMGPWLKLGLGAVAFSVLLWFPLLRGITRSVAKMTQATRTIAEGRFDVRLSSARRDELGELADSINQMAARLDGFVKGQKRFLGDIAHELCSPLARLQMALGIIEQNSSDKQLAYAQSASEKAGQIATLVNALLDFSKASFEAQSVHLRPVDLHEAVGKALAGESVPDGGATLDIPAGLTACADPELLVRALANLVRNAIRHNEQFGKIIITAMKSGANVILSVADCGTGVPEAELPKIFDAFYRLDASRTRDTGGVGLGLTIVKTCVESCHGSVTARNRQPHGLEVIITLQAACPPPQA